MPLKNYQLDDYEPVKPATALRAVVVEPGHRPAKEHRTTASSSVSVAESAIQPIANSEPAGNESWSQKAGHRLSFAGVFFFTFLVYFRPYELFPSLSWLSKSAFFVAIATLVVFIPTQLALENKLTARPREVSLALLLLLTGLLSIPLALQPMTALQSFTEFLKVVLVFIVLVNVLRNEQRLRALILLVLVASCVLSVAALSDYIQGNLALQGRRIAGLIGGLFSNPNDLALHLVTMIPISAALMMGSRAGLKKFAYLASSLLLMMGLIATFSRGGFLGFMCATGFMGWKLARRNRIVFGAIALTLVAAAVALAPGAYRSRISDTSDDSAVARTDDLKRSIIIAARHPVFGVGMDNYILYSNTNKATHNAYTQVAAEMGIGALLIYVAFVLTPFRRLRIVEQGTRGTKRRSALQYLAIGLQASLVGYMVVSFFASVAYLWYVYYLVAYSVCLRRITSHSISAASVASSPQVVARENRLTHADPVAQTQ